MKEFKGYNSIKEIKEANKRKGHFFFSQGALDFFRSKIYPIIYQKKYFITSEIDPFEHEAFTIREAKENGEVDTVGEFHSFRDYIDAEKYIKTNLINKTEKGEKKWN